MRRALLFSMDGYTSLQPFRGIVRQDTFSLRQLLGDPMFGEFDSRLYEDEGEGCFFVKVRDFFCDAGRSDELLLFFAGHAEKASGGEVTLAAVDWKPAADSAALVTFNRIAEWVRKSAAGQISIIVDACHSTHLVSALDARLKDDRQAEAALLKAARSVQVLVSGDNTRTNGLHTALTQTLLDGVRTGAAGGRRNRCNLFDLREHAAMSVRSVNAPRTYAEYGVDRQHIIASNPHRGEDIPRAVVIDLWSGDTRRVGEAVKKLIWMWGHKPALQVRANELLTRFENSHPAVVPEIQTLLDSWKTGTAARRPRKEHARQILLIYNSRNALAAEAARIAFGSEQPRPRLFDLDAARGYQFTDISLMTWIEGGGRTLWFLDRETTRHLSGRDRDLALALGAHPAASDGQAIYWVEAPPVARPEVLSRARLASTPGETIETFVGRLLNRDPAGDGRHTGRGGQPGNSPGPLGVVRDAKRFLRAAQEHDDRLAQHNRQQTHDEQFPVREPKFLVFRQGDTFVLAICDIDAHVRTSMLRCTYEPEVPARPATEDELNALGFPNRAVDPMFIDPLGQISRVYIDGNLLFQHLMFPRSLVKVPEYTSAPEHKVELPISTFIRTLQQLHGEDRVVFASIVERPKKPDPLLQQMLQANFTFTRFAPSPSNSLHIGSLRTALLSYLFALLHPEDGRFHIRFDDTDTPPKQAAASIRLIEEDLRWVGFGDLKTYRQTSEGATLNYRKVLELFQRSGLCRTRDDGVAELAINTPERTVCYWFDLKRGPQIRHAAPVYSTYGDKGPALDYSLTFEPDDGEADPRFKYKFAGAIDDILHNSLVIRDIRQSDSFFTARQAAIISMLREALAYPRDERCRKLADEIRQVTKRVQANRSRNRPFPFPCPPLYLHVTRVSSEDGESLSKRNLQPEHSLSVIRERSLFLPETLVVWCLRSYGSRLLEKIGCRSISELVDRVGREGLEYCLSSIAQSLTFADLVAVPQAGSVWIQGLNRIDRRLVARLPPHRIGSFVRDLYARHGVAAPPKLSEFVGRLYEHRAFISGAEELAALALVFARGHTSDLPEALGAKGIDLAKVASSSECGSYAGLSSSTMECLRFLVLGRMKGPPLTTLRYILSDDVFHARAMEGAQRYAAQTAVPA